MIVLNGASSSGKSSIAVELQGLLPRPFLTFGVDTLVAALPPASPAHEPGIAFGSDGVVAVGDRFRQLEHAWYQGLAAIARDDVGVIIDEVFLEGRESQDRLRSALGGLWVVWVGVRCDLEVAVAREVVRPERTRGMASSQAMIVHEGVQYDLQVDTTTSTALECATTIADYLADR
ncbi:MAG: chloramphenicol phosphotransferase [Dermatophilaceae bacterium]|nr:chloramphenicol phosphotransferase [Dermatophilaceae bacterium]